MTEELDGVWRALADPTRRRLLDLLRTGPMTTGALVAEFDMSRFGVMKHLAILEAAGLITIRRSGRERFNHLNAVPLRRVYERWVDDFSDHWARSLLDIKQLSETGETSMKEFEIVQEVVIQAPRKRVWSALTSEIGQWWAFRTGTDNSQISLEARLGGAFSERWGDGEGALWGTVTYLKLGERLRLEGALGMSGPAVNKYTYDLEDCDGATKLKLTHYGFGQRDDDVERNYTEGWKALLGTYLVGWIDDGKTYDQLSQE